LTTFQDAPPPKKSIPIGQALVMISIISLFWTAAACLGSWIAFNGLAAQTPRLASGMIGDAIGNVVDNYMTYMYYRDAQAAWYLFSAEDVSYEDIEAQLTDHYEWFDGYLGLEVTEAEGLPDQFPSDNQPYEELMAGRVVTLRGDIEYEDGFTGTFVAVLEYDEDGKYWGLQSVEISVPPEKIEAMND
jgi:hypothetical protein